MLLRFAIVFLCILSFATQADTPLLWNQKAYAPNCPLRSQALWVTYKGGADCIRYFSAGNLQDAPLVVVIFRGDRETWIRRDPRTIPANTATAQRRQAARMHARTGLPVVIIARPGTYGSSGNHYRRRQPAEYLALNAAVDGLRERYHIKNFILSGHSGGATAASALLTFGRRDIRCAILTSGAWDLLNRAEAQRKLRGEKSDAGKDLTGLRHPYDPLYHIDGIIHDPQRLIMVIGNLQDKTTPFNLQVKFAQALRENNHRVLLIEWPALPPVYHNLKGNPGIKYVDRCKSAGLAKRRA